MMPAHFRTPIRLQKASFQLSHSDKILCIGSCFAENIGCRLQAAQFDMVVNPFGITYNPVSIGEQLAQLLSGRVYTAADLEVHRGLYFSWQHHGHFDDADPNTVLHRINTQLELGREQLKTATHLMLTLGTAQVFALPNGHIVNNCHKVSAANFVEYRLTLAQSIEALSPVVEALLLQRPDIRIIFTVSPVRHLRRGAVENQRSKAILTLTADYFEQKYPEAVHYFAANELLLDDLRDYRFYAEDMLHPSVQAVDYIFEHFAETYFSTTTRSIITDIERLQAAAAHRPFRANTPEHQEFVQAQLAQLDAFEQKFGLILSEVRATFEAQRAEAIRHIAP